MSTKNWYTNTKPDALQGVIIEEETGRNVAVSYDPADARLIAAAPELLAELESIEAQAEETAEGRCFGDPHALRVELKAIAAKARAAIDKATQS